MVFFLRSHGESVREVFLGHRPIAPEIRAGVPMSFVALAIALGAILTIHQFAPYLRTEGTESAAGPADLAGRRGDHGGRAGRGGRSP